MQSKQKSEKPVQYPIRKMGKYTCYEEHQDGSIEIAHKYRARFDVISSQRMAIESLLKIVLDHLTLLQKNTTETSRELWDELADDIGIDIKNIQYNYQSGGILTKVKQRD